MRIIIDTKPKITGGTTNAQINDPGITYNQSGATYNDSRYTYGGIYGNSDGLKPTIATLTDFQDFSSSQRGYSYGLLLALTKTH